jgi:putative Holliday junction resolvase
LNAGPRSTATAIRPDSGRVIGFDFGEKRIGVAVGELTLRIAHPLTTIQAEDNTKRFAAIAAIIDIWRPVALVVGVPRPADGRPHEIARLAQRFARRLEGRFGLATPLIDERLSSYAAEMALRDQGAKRRDALDAAAAQPILQSYFDALA